MTDQCLGPRERAGTKPGHVLDRVELGYNQTDSFWSGQKAKILPRNLRTRGPAGSIADISCQ